MSKNSNDNDTVISFSDKVKQIKLKSKQEPLLDVDELEQSLIDEDVIELGLETFSDTLTDATGFISITFDSEGDPAIVYAGVLDVIKTLGALEFIKNAVLNEDLVDNDN